MLFRSVTYRITIFGDCDTNLIENEVTALLCGLGCQIREKNLLRRDEKDADQNICLEREE